MSTIFKKFRKGDIAISPYTANKDYLVYISDYTGSYFESNYEQFRVFDHPITSSQNTAIKIVSLSVFTYDSEYDESDFTASVYGSYGALLSASTHTRTTNEYFKRAIHDSLQGMYYTNPDDPCYTLDNSGYEKEYRELNRTAQVISVPQKMMGDNIKKGSVKIQSGSGANRITLYDDGYGNLYDNELTGSEVSGAVATSQSVNFVSQSILALNFNDLHNNHNKAITAHSIKRLNTYSQTYGSRFNISNRIRFFERSRFFNKVEAYNITPNTSSTQEGTVILLDGITPPTTESRVAETSHSMIRIKHRRAFNFGKTLSRRKHGFIYAPQNLHQSANDYSVALRVSCSVDQPSYNVINANGPYNYIASKLDDVYRGGFPFSIRYCNENANGTTTGTRGGIQVLVSDGRPINNLKLNSITSLSQSNQYHDVVFVKTGSNAQLWINGTKEAEGAMPQGRTDNSDDIIIGARSCWKGRYKKGNPYLRKRGSQSPSNRYGRQFKKEIEYFRNFKGGLSSFMMFDKALTPEEIAYYSYTSGSFSSLVGNVFYNHGLITLTSLDSKYSNNTDGGMLSECTLSFKNSHEIFEHEYNCHIKDREYTYTMNPTIVDDIESGTLKSFTTTSAWSPYVTSIGLYDEKARLIAIGKLSRPIKKSEDYDTTYIVRFDT